MDRPRSYEHRTSVLDESPQAAAAACRRWVRGAAICAGLLSSMLVPPQVAFGQALPVENRVLLRVNDRIVTQYTFERQVAAGMASITRQNFDPDQLTQRRAELPRQVLRGLWDELLILSRADQLGLTVSEFEVEQAIDSQMQQFEMQTREELERALEQNGLSLAEFRKTVEIGLLQRQVWGRELFPRVNLEEDELRRVYREHLEDYQVSETRDLEELVVLESDAGSELDAMAARVAAAWSRGDSPEEIIEREGDAVRYIALGSVVQDELAPALGSVAFSLSEGQVSEPVVARGGLHVVKVVGIAEARVQAFEEVREQVNLDERARRFEQEREKYLRELEQHAYYELNLPPELADFRTSSGFVPGAGGLKGLAAGPLGIELNERRAPAASEGDGGIGDSDTSPDERG